MNRLRRLTSCAMISKPRGFTLVELVVAVVIVIALAALAFPLVKKGITKAKVAKKTSIYRQHFLVGGMYSADHNGEIMPARDIHGWQTLMIPYLMGDGTKVTVETCTAECFVDPLWSGLDLEKPWITGVGINFRPGLPKTHRQNIFWGDDRDTKAAKRFRMAQITHPSQRIFSGDSRSWYVSQWHVATARHGDGDKGMFVMFDGRVAFLNANEADRAISNPGE